MWLSDEHVHSQEVNRVHCAHTSLPAHLEYCRRGPRAGLELPLFLWTQCCLQDVRLVSAHSCLQSLHKGHTLVGSTLTALLKLGVSVAQSCLTLCDRMDCSLPGSSVHWDCPGKNTGVGCYFLLQGIFQAQESTQGPLHCRQIPYNLNHQGNPKTASVFPTLLFSPLQFIFLKALINL